MSKKLLFSLLAIIMSVQCFAQSGRIVKGVVTDEYNEPLPGAIVRVAGTETGVTTDANGQFALNLKDGKDAKLTVTFVGMTPQTISLTKSQKNVTVSMKYDNQVLDNVVVTGYQTISKERTTGSYGVIGGEQLEKKISTDLSNLVEGQVAGLVLNKDGSLTIRGIGTLNAEVAPLIVVDGYPTEIKLSDLNPDNIENITVLKDAVAASIYGSRAANGVITVTTKQGKMGKTTVAYKGSFAVQLKPNLDDLHLGSTSDYIDAELALYNLNPNGGNYKLSTQSENMSLVNQLIAQRDANMISEADFNSQIAALRNVDALKQMEDYMMRNKMTQSHNVSLSGGNAYNRYNLSVNYKNTKDTYINTSDNRLIVDLKNEWTPYKFVTVKTAANVNYNNSTAPSSSYLTLAQGTSYVKPYSTLVDKDGNPVAYNTLSYGLQQLYSSYDGLKDLSYNPITDADEDYSKTSSYAARLNAALNFHIYEGLEAEIGGSWQHGNSLYRRIATQNSFLMRRAYNGSTQLDNPSSHYIPNGDLVDETRYSNENWTIRTQFSYNNTFGKHRVSALAGNEVRRISYDNNSYATRVGYNAVAGSYTPIDIFELNNYTYDSNMLYDKVVTLRNGSYTRRDTRFVSWYANGAYEYDNRYLVSGSIREDLTNFFGTDPKYRYRPLWSVGGTWKINNEDFFDVSWVDRLYLRASYGVNGNISLSEGPYMILSAGSYNSTTGGVANGISSYPNNSLRWEKTQTTNIGLDADFLGNRLGFSIDYYFKRSSDILAKDAMDPTTGVSSMTRNVGAIHNSGVELSFRAVPVKTEDFRWASTLNLSFNRSEVKKYNVSRLYSTYWAYVQPVHAEGYPMNGLFGYEFRGLNEKGQVQITDGLTGDKKLASLSEVEDIIYLGTATPKTEMSFTNEFSYKNWDLSFMFIGKFGHKFRKDVFQGSNYRSRYFSQRWQKAGDEEHTIYPNFSSWNMDLFYFPFCDVNCGNASYVKLRDLTLSYNFDKKLINKIGMGSARVYAQARNLFRITAKGVDIDPEAYENNMSGGMGSSSEAGYSTMPIRPEFYVGLSFSF